MAIGNSLAILTTDKLSRYVVNALGICDLHTHFRIKPLIKFLQRNKNILKNATILEIGCGCGVNLFEVFKIDDTIRASGYDLDKSVIQIATNVSNQVFGGKIQFFCDDCTTLNLENNFDLILLIDFLEHINDPITFLSNIDLFLKTGGYLLISVPTRCYPWVFGKAFHREVGHVMDGYTLELLNQQILSNYNLEAYTYNTGIIASIGCFFYYQHIRKIRNPCLRDIFIFLNLIIFKWFDLLKFKQFSSSLFAVYRKL